MPMLKQNLIAFAGFLVVMFGAAVLTWAVAQTPVVPPIGTDGSFGLTPSELVGWICANQSSATWFVGLFYALAAHLGFSSLSGILKKFGISDGFMVWIVRLLAIDLKPPPATIVAQAAAIQSGPAPVAAAEIPASKGS